MRFYYRHTPTLLQSIMLASLAVLLVNCQSAPSGINEEAAEQAIRDVLAQQVEAWNKGDIDTYMEGYWQSDDLRFASGGSVQYGWQTTLERYHRRYPDRGAMGQLTFSDLDVRLLHASNALVFGRWHLQRTGEYADIGGLFTLIFEYDAHAQAWHIVHDHTSTEEG